MYVCKLSAVAWLHLFLWHSIIELLPLYVCIILRTLHFIIISSFIVIDSNVVWATRGVLEGGVCEVEGEVWGGCLVGGGVWEVEGEVWGVVWLEGGVWEVEGEVWGGEGCWVGGGSVGSGGGSVGSGGGWKQRSM